MSPKIYRQKIGHWYLERIIFLLAGIFVAVSTIAAIAGYVGFQYFTLLVGIMLVNFSLTGYCPLAIVASKLGIKER